MILHTVLAAAVMMLEVSALEGVQTCSATVIRGLPGRDGLPGQDGKDGLPGQDGRDGLPGQDGKDGLPGQDGKDGLPGQDGKDGLPGQDGKDGLPGENITCACGAGYQAIPQEVLNQMKQEIKEEILSQITAENVFINECTGNGTKTPMPTSCHDIQNKIPKSGIYKIYKITNNEVCSKAVYCDLETSYSGVKGWTRVAFFNMTNSSHSCPSPLQEVSAGGKRLCRRSVNTPFSSVKFDSFGISYTQVCGRAIAYQFGNPNAFATILEQNLSINAAYMDGISITHGLPRKHIWTFAVGRARTGDHARYACPCSASSAPPPPQYVGTDYYCDSVNIGTPVGINYYLSRPIWDGQGCPNSITCCDNNSETPWFCKTLPNATTDQIEVRWMSDQDLGNEATPTELLELYIH